VLQTGDESRQAALRILVWQPAESPLRQRIIGQTNDLNVRVVTESQVPVPVQADAQWRESRQLAERHTAQLVTWFDVVAMADRRLLLRIALPRQQRLLERDLGRAASGGERVTVPSVGLEAAAVIVRETVQALLAGESVGTEDPRRFEAFTETRSVTGTQADLEAAAVSDTPNTPSSSTPSSSTPSSSTPSSSTPNPPATSSASTEPLQLPALRPSKTPPAARPQDDVTAGDRQTNQVTLLHHSAFRWHLGAALHLNADGLGPAATSEGLGVRGARDAAAWLEVGVAASANLPVTVKSELGAFRLQRQQLTLDASTPLTHSDWRLSAGFRVGLIAYYRRNLSLLEGVSDRGSATHWVGCIGPEMRLSYPASSRRLRLEAAVGIDIPTRMLEVGYQRPSGFSTATRGWPLQPQVQLGIDIGI
jgi:hypothetical protein